MWNRCDQGSCLPRHCCGLLKLLKGKVANFVKQKKRIASSAKQAASKAGKQAIFAPLISKLRAAGGGNASNLLCNNASGTPGADNLKALMMELEMCEANIEAACNTGLPAHNETMTMECEMFMDAFSDMTKPALAASGEASCDLWTADSLAMAAAKIKGTACDISSLSKEFTAAKKNCTSAFGACRKLEDKVVSAIDACSAANTEASLKASIAQGVTNKDLSDQVVAMAASKASSATTTASMKRMKRSTATTTTTTTTTTAAETTTTAATTTAATTTAATTTA